MAVNLERLDAALHIELGLQYMHIDKLERPILHLSMHGDKSGIELTDYEVVKWMELRKRLVRINSEARGKLIVCISSCYGFGGLSGVVRKGNDSPFGYLVGNKEEVQWEDLVVGFVSFYHHLLKKGTEIEKAVEAMKVASGNDNFAWITTRA